MLSQSSSPAHDAYNKLILVTLQTEVLDILRGALIGTTTVLILVSIPDHVGAAPSPGNSISQRGSGAGLG